MLGFAVPLGLLLVFVGLTGGAAVLYEQGLFGQRHPMLAPLAFLTLTVLFAAGSARLLVRGLRRAEEGAAAAAGWRRGKLATGLVAAAAVLAFTFWIMDLAARQQLLALRAEAPRLGLIAGPAGVRQIAITRSLCINRPSRPWAQRRTASTASAAPGSGTNPGKRPGVRIGRS